MTCIYLFLYYFVNAFVVLFEHFIQFYKIPFSFYCFKLFTYIYFFINVFISLESVLYIHNILQSSFFLILFCFILEYLFSLLK